MSKQVHIVILNWNNAEATTNTVRNILSWPHIRPLIHIVDNHSSDNSYEQISKAFPEIQMHSCTENLGFAGGNNTAIRHIPTSETDFILLLNNDAIVSEESIQLMLNVLEKHDKLAVIGPILNESHESTSQPYCGGRDMGRFIHTRIPYVATHSPDKYTCVDYVPGTVFLARASIFETYGLLDEQYFFSGEIADFCKRLQVNGCQCAISLQTEALHKTENSPLRETLYAYYTLRNRFLYIRKHHPKQYTQKACFWALCGMAMFAMALLKGRFHTCRAIYLALTDGLKGNFGNKNDYFIS